MNKKVKLSIETAVLLVLLIGLQFVTRTMGQLITGTCVNFILALTTLVCGLSAGILAALVSPVAAFLIGIGPGYAYVVPAVCVGNVIMVMILYIFIGRKNDYVKWAVRIAGLLVAGTAKFTLLFLGVLNLVVPALNVPEDKVQTIVDVFSWPQLVTSVVGSLLAALIYAKLKKVLKNEPVEEVVYVKEKRINPDELAECEPADDETESSDGESDTDGETDTDD